MLLRRLPYLVIIETQYKLLYFIIYIEKYFLGHRGAHGVRVQLRAKSECKFEIERAADPVIRRKIRTVRVIAPIRSNAIEDRVRRGLLGKKIFLTNRSNNILL